MFKYHLLALLLGTVLDAVFGRIYSIWNPFDTIKEYVRFLDRALLGDEIILIEDSKQRQLGLWLVFLVIAPVLAVVLFFNMLFYEISIFTGVIFEAFATYLCLEGHYLFYGGRAVMSEYYGSGFAAMKRMAEKFTFSDSKADTAEALTKETITYIASGATDLVLNPFLIAFFFGPVGAFLYRCLHIIESRVGIFSNGCSKENRYMLFGYYPAKLIYLIGYIPNRINGALTVFAAKYTFGDFNGKNAQYIHLRDRFKAVSAYAGALGITLKNGHIGDEDNIASPKDLRTATNLLRNTCMIYQLILVILLLIF